MLPEPSRYGWTQTFDDPGYATEVDQHSYGHRAQKRTWLYYVGSQPPALEWGYAPPDLPMISRARSAPRGA